MRLILPEAVHRDTKHRGRCGVAVAAGGNLPPISISISYVVRLPGVPSPNTIKTYSKLLGPYSIRNGLSKRNLL